MKLTLTLSHYTLSQAINGSLPFYIFPRKEDTDLSNKIFFQNPKYGTVEDKYNYTSINTFAKQLARMYEITGNNIGMKQIAYKTYKSKLNVNDRVYMYMPRLRHVKLVNKWHGPFRVIEALHPVYIIEILTNHGIVEEAIPRDRLKKTVRYIEPEEIDLDQQNIDRSNSNGASDRAVNLNYDFSDSDDSDLENQNVVG